MKAAIIVALALSAPLASAAERDLKAQIVETDGWVAYEVPMIADAGEPCCYSSRNNWRRGECDLDGHSWSFGTNDNDPRPAVRSGSLALYVHVANRRIDRVRPVAASCEVKSANAIRRIDGVDSAQSVKLVSDWLGDAKGDDDHDDLGLAALAYHADPAATRALAAKSEPSHPRKVREQALFWLGQTRGVEGAGIVERYATTDSDPELRAQAIFALSQSHAGDPYERIHAISSSDPSDHVRSQALFWMAQMEDKRAAADITAAVGSERSEDVREQAVFALSQLKDDQADDALIALLQGKYPRDVKKQALFWLGESGTPRAMQFFDEALK